MTDDELERMRAYAAAAREHPTWSVAYAQDVQKLLAELEQARDDATAAASYADEQWQRGQLESGLLALEEDRNHWRRKAETFRELLGKVAAGPRCGHGYRPPTAESYVDVQINDDTLAAIVEASRGLKLRSGPWHRLRFCEMVLDRLGAEVDGIPWRQAARLSEALDGEPVTEPVAPMPGSGVSS